MKFIVDAQLPKTLCELLEELGEDSIHTLDLPEKNKTHDQEVLRIALEESRVVVTKDSDFVQHYLLNGAPPKLLLVATGNIRNDSLLLMFRKNHSFITALLADKDFIELTKDKLIVHS